MVDERTSMQAAGVPDAHFFTRFFAFGILAAMSAGAVVLAMSGSGTIFAG